MTKPSPRYELAPLVSLISELAHEGGVVLWIGDGRVPGLSTVAALTQVKVLDPGITRPLERDGLNVEPRPRSFADQHAAWSVIVDLSVLGDDPKLRLAELIEVSEHGLIVRWLGQEPGLEKRLQDSFKHTRLYEQSSFLGSSLIAEGDGVLLDDSLARGVKPEARVLVCSKRALDLDSVVIARQPTAPTKGEPEREEPAKNADDAYGDLEARLLERGRYVATLEKEIERQEALVRDVLVQWQKVQNDQTEAPPEDASTLRRLRDENTSLTLQIAAAQEALKELKTAAAAKDALVTRLQLELADLENSGSGSDEQLARLRAENDRLREAVLGVAIEADVSPQLLSAWKAGRQVLERLRWLLRDLQADQSDQTLSQTVVGIEPPITTEEHPVREE